jgi:signal transduction protein with GAF and PtsI domain
MNAGLAVDLDILAETGAEGIGLFRTEFQFMVSEELPRLERPDGALREGAGQPPGDRR